MIEFGGNGSMAGTEYKNECRLSTLVTAPEGWPHADEVQAKVTFPQAKVNGVILALGELFVNRGLPAPRLL